MKRFQRFVLAVCAFALAVSACPVRAEPGTAARVPPIFWYETDPETRRRFLMALLVYWSARGPEGEFDLLAPFYYRSESENEKLRILLPFHFLYRTPGTKLGLWGPYFSKESLRSRTRFLFPLYLDMSSLEGRTTIAPLFFRSETARYDLRTIFPLYWNYRPTDQRKRAYQLILPLYLKAKNRDSRLIVSPLFLAYRDDDVSQGLIPPYYWRHSEGKKTEIGFPFYWRFLRQKDSGPRDIQVAIPWFKYRSGSTTFRGFVPLYLGRTKIIRENEGEDNNTKRSTSTALSLSTSTKVSQWDIVFPLYARFERPDGSLRIWTPLYSKFRDWSGKTYGHGGLSFESRNPWGGRLVGMFPFLYARQEPDYEKFRLLLWYRYRTADNLHAQTSLFPLFHWSRNGDRRQLITPLAYVDRDPEVSRGFVLAYFWRTDRRESDPGRPVVSAKRILFPLAWSFQSENEKTTVFPPLAAFHRHGDYKLSIVAPLYFRRQKGEDTFTLVPPFLSRRSPQRQWLGLFFLYYRTAQSDSKAITLLPLFRRSTFKDGSSLYLPGFYYLRAGEESQGIAGPYLWDHRGKTQYDIALPLFWRFKRPTWQIKTIFPGYVFENLHIKEKGFFPIWAVTKGVERSTVSFTPLPVQDKSAPVVNGIRDADIEVDDQDISTHPVSHFLADSHRVLPFYFYRKLPNGYDLMLPFVMGRIEKTRNPENQATLRGRMLLLAYWEAAPEQRVVRVDPLYAYHRSPDRKGFTIPTAPFPLWRYEVAGLKKPKEERTTVGAVFPYYWRRSKTLDRDMAVPLYYHRVERDETGSTETVRVTWLLLYYASQNREEEKSKRIVFPLYWRFAEKDEALTIVPPVWMDRGANYQRTIVFPLWWSFRKDQASFKTFFPLYLKDEDRAEGRSSTLMPFYWRSKEPGRSTLLVGNFFRKVSVDAKEQTTVAFPLYWSSDGPKRSARTIFPLYWRWEAEDKRVTYLFPLYFRHQREHFDWQITFPLFWKLSTDDSVTRVVPPYFSVLSKTTGTRTTGFAPLWTYARNAREEWSDFQFLGGLFRYERTATESRLTLLYFLKI